MDAAEAGDLRHRISIVANTAYLSEILFQFNSANGLLNEKTLSLHRFT